MKSLLDLTRDFHNARKMYEKLNADTPRIIGIIGVKVINENFNLQGFAANEGAVQKWKPRSKVTNKIYDSRHGVKGSVYSSQNPILWQTGDLKDGVHYIASGKRVRIGVNLNIVPYAKLMNEGGLVKFGSRTVRIPQRRYLGMSQKLSLRSKAEIKRKRQLAFSRFKMSV